MADALDSKGDHDLANRFSLTHLMPVTSEESAAGNWVLTAAILLRLFR